MTAINSNRAIRGPVTAVPVVAGKGVRLVADTDNNRWVVEADETVLWEGTPSNTGPFTLSESASNFQYLEFYIGNTNPTPDFIQAYKFSASSPKIKLINYRCEEDPAFKLGMVTLEVSGTSITVKSGSAVRYIWYTNGQFNANVNASQAPYVFKIVGINRIASN